MKTKITGKDLLHEPSLNKGTAFTDEERDTLGLRGLLPPRVNSIETQLKRALSNLRHKTTALEKHIFMVSLQDRNETLFYRAVMENMDELMPIIYTPVVGKACQEFDHIFRRPRGLYITANDRGKVANVLRNWPNPDVRVIVVTDGERILGLGDLSANGMGIPIGKLALYTACAGIHPAWCLPITIDVGTENDLLRNDPLYLGLAQHRVKGKEYDALIEEFVMAVQEVFPYAVIQFEDFANQNAFRLLKKYEDRVCTFNDDIQGTAAVALAGIYSALRITKKKLIEQRFLFFGAGEAGTGIADLVVDGMVEEGMTVEEARSRCWFIDSRGLVVKGRDDLAEHKLPYAVDNPPMTETMKIMDLLSPTGIIGVSGQPYVFTEEIFLKMAKLNERPIVFALSNPTSQSECTADAAYKLTQGRCVFASGSPFPPVYLHGQTFIPGQGNNSYIFPGVGLGLVASVSRRVTREMFLVAARSLAQQVTEKDLALGRIYPALSTIRKVSANIAVAIAEVAYARGLASNLPKPENLPAYVNSLMYVPEYR